MDDEAKDPGRQEATPNDRLAGMAERCLKCNSSRLIYADPVDAASVRLSSSDTATSFFNLKFGRAEFCIIGCATICLDCGFLASTVDLKEVITRLKTHATDALLQRVGITKPHC